MLFDCRKEHEKIIAKLFEELSGYDEERYRALFLGLLQRRGLFTHTDCGVNDLILISGYASMLAQTKFGDVCRTNLDTIDSEGDVVDNDDEFYRAYGLMRKVADEELPWFWRVWEMA